MFRVEGPFPGYRTTLILPSPDFGNSRALASTVQPVRTMNGTLYTYVKNKRGRKAHVWEFTVAKEKSLEAKAFVDAYISSVIRITDHEDVIHLGNLTLNPLELTGDGRANGWPGGEAYRFALQLEEKV